MSKYLTAIFSLVAASQTCLSQEFADTPVTPTEMENVYKEVKWADFDGDKDMDAVNANFFTGITFFRNDNSSMVQVEGVIEGDVTYQEGDLVLVDFDANGYIDIILQESGKIVVLLNQGNFDFSLHHTGIDFTYAGSSPIQCLDIDGDADVDIIANRQIFVNVNGVFTRSVVQMPPGGDRIFWGDLNNDGLMDMVNLYYTSLEPHIAKGGGLFEATTELANSRPDGSFFLFDADGDSDLDMFVSEAGYQYGIYKNSFAQTGEVTFAKGYHFTSFISKVAYGDINRDGLADLVIYGYLNTGATTYALLNTSSPAAISFTATDLQIPGTVSSAMGLLDFDLDGDLDIHLATNDYSSSPYGSHKIYLNEQAAPVSPAPAVPSGLSTTVAGEIVLKWDINPKTFYEIEIDRNTLPLLGSYSHDDGSLMMPKTEWPVFSDHYTLTNLPAGNYRWRVHAVDYASRASAFTSYQDFTVAEGPVASISGTEFTSSVLNWTYAGAAPTEFEIFRRSPTEAWSAIARVPGTAMEFTDTGLANDQWYEYMVKAVTGTSRSAPSVTLRYYTGQFLETEFGTKDPNIVAYSGGVADIDNDKDYDMQFVGHVQGDSQVGMENNGQGTFSSTSWLPALSMDSYHQLLFTGDMDSDNDVDMCALIGESYNRKIAVFTNTDGIYTNSFMGSVSLVEGFAPPIVHDFNNDGLMDVFYVGKINNWSPVEYRLLFQKRDGDFTASSFIVDANSTSSRNFKLVDINNDGFIDIYFAGIDSPLTLPRLAINQQGSGFEIKETAIPSVPNLHFQDVNADGIVDLVYPHQIERLVIQLGTGDNSYGEPVFLRALNFNYTMNVHSADLDFDGWPELVLDDHYNVGIMKNKGNGSFELSSYRPAFGGSTRFLLSDIENDGDVDLVRMGSDQWQGLNRIYENRWSSPTRKNSKPSAPANVTTVSQNGTLLVEWSASTDDTTPQKLLTYNISITDTQGKRWVSSGTDETGTFRNVFGSGNAGARTFYPVTGLPAGEYKVKVQAADASFALSPWSQDHTVIVPEGPANLTCQRLLLNKIKLSWTSELNEDKLIVQRKTESEGFKTVAELAAGTTTFIDEGLPYNQQYSYRVSSVVNGTWSGPSNVVSHNSMLWELKATSLPNADRSIDVGDFNGDSKMDVVLSGNVKDGYNYTRVKATFESTTNGFVRRDFGDPENPMLEVVAFLDLNQDNLLDLYEHGYERNNGYRTNIFQNNGDNTFRLNFNKLTETDLEISSLIDFDLDNDLDLYVVDKPDNGMPSAKMLRNTAGSYEVASVLSPSCIGYYCNFSSLAGDFDNDGADDFFGGTTLYLNKKGRFVATTSFPSGTGFYRKLDFNGDGWLDILFIGTNYYGSPKLYKNSGKITNGQLQFEVVNLAIPAFGNLGISPNVADFDHDGNTDIVFVGNRVTHLSSLSDGSLTTFTLPAFGASGTSKVIDYDLDGDLDIIITGSMSENNIQVQTLVAKVLENKLIDGGNGIANNPPALPSNLRTEQDENGIHFRWDPPLDDHTKSEALSYDVVLYKDGVLVSRGSADPSTGSRKNLASGASYRQSLLKLQAGEYQWRVQAIDQAYSASAFTEPQTFTSLPGPPIMEDTVIYRCGRTVMLTAIGENIKWYSDSLKTNFLAAGTFSPMTSQTVYVTQTTGNLEGVAAKVEIAIYDKPAPPWIFYDKFIICETYAWQLTLNASGTGLKWYAEQSLSTPVGFGESIQVEPETADFFVTQTLNGCESVASTVTVEEIVIDSRIAIEGEVIRVMENDADTYQWFRNNVRIESATSNTYNFANSLGTYMVSMQKGGCIEKSPEVVITDIEDNLNGIQIFPNPANHFVLIAVPSIGYTITVHDANGRKMLTDLLDNNGQFNLDVSNWAKGLYAVTISTATKTYVSKLMVK